MSTALAQGPVTLARHVSGIWRWDVPWVHVSLALVACAVYLYHPVRSGFQDGYQYFVYLARGFLQGQLSIVDPLPIVADLSWYNGHYYLYWPPFPAVLLMPFVAVFGLNTNQTVFNLVVGSLNVALISWLLLLLHRRGIADLTPAKRVWLTLFFAFGTVHAVEAPFGMVWQTAEVVGVALSVAAYIAALALPPRWAPLVTGGLIGLGFLSRTPTAPAGIGAIWFLLTLQRPLSRRELATRLLAAGAPIAASVLALLAYNAARFGNALDMGYAYQLRSPFFDPLYQTYGPFNAVYMPINLFYNFIAIPHLALLGPQPQVNYWMGGSLFLMSPTFLLAFVGIARAWRRCGAALATSVCLSAMPMLFLMGTGFTQYGPRYTLDFIAPLMVATAIGASPVSTRAIGILSTIGMAMYGPGFLIGNALVQRIPPS